MLKLLCIDPGPKRSGWVFLDASVYPPAVLNGGNDENIFLLDTIRGAARLGHKLLLEKMSGRATGKHGFNDDVIDTVIWTGRFHQAYIESADCGDLTEFVVYITRGEVKTNLGVAQNKSDPDVNFALRCIYNEPPAPKRPKAALKEVTDHMWAALAVGIGWLRS